MEGEKRYIIQTPNGQTFGPSTLPEIVEWAKLGSMPIGSIAIDQETGERTPVASVPGLAENIPATRLSSLSRATATP